MTTARTQTPDDAFVSEYRRLGFVLCDNLLPSELIADINADMDVLIAGAAGITDSNEILDLEDSHTPDTPRVRRIKDPDRHSQAVRRALLHPALRSVLTRLIGPNVRLHGTKLNAKSGLSGSAIEWHQDWAFYPHTNDDLLAAGIMLDDVDDENGPTLVVPGSFRGPIHDHTNAGVFCGAIDPSRIAGEIARAVPLTGKAGSVTFHHVRTLHGADINRSVRRRRILFVELAAADAWPLAGGGSSFTTLEEFDKRMLFGTPGVEPRMTQVPVRMPLPLPHGAWDTIYEIQKSAGRTAFGAEPRQGGRGLQVKTES